MYYYESMSKQAIKHNQTVCGDVLENTRIKSGSYFGVFDGIGSGIYANIAATECASRWSAMIERGLSFSETCEKMATLMHKARTHPFPFTAFNCAKLTSKGHVQIFTYEAPKPVMVRNGVVHVIEPRYYTVGYEIIGESKTSVQAGDQILLFSDGVSQAGLGNGYKMGWGETGLLEFYNKICSEKSGEGSKGQTKPPELLECILDQCKNLSGGKHYDDTSMLIISCKVPKHLHIFTGPPSAKDKDKFFAAAFQKASGIKMICGSTTADILSRELNEPIKLKEQGMGFNSPPEYAMKGAAMVTEGAMVLNQVCNILDADPIEVTEETSPERIANHFYNADVIHFHVGNAKNKSHQLLPFRQLGLKLRYDVLKDIEQKLKQRGKTVFFDFY
ncbi:MAG TPA: SpoIIE family protein phosphatase [Thermotogota bacterium]|nr:SpoIIE family protein phosphatase [Thermotogota bacterium]HRW34860.1 SpoIIE family protein phosphatase [Thermotogota bacterium]